MSGSDAYAGVDPAVIDRQRRRSDMVRAALARVGDDGTAPRHVAHYVFPLDTGATGTDPAPDDAVTAALAPYGDKVGFSATGGGLVLEQHRDVAAGDFDLQVAALQALMAGLDWTYDGWDCAVAGRNEGKASQ